MATAVVTVETAAVSFSDGEMTAERDARLLEVGEYPDKGLTVTEADLDGIVTRFGAGGPGGVPVKVEHVDTPLDPLGEVRRVWRVGGALMGRLAFPADLAGFLRRRGVQKLSVGLSRDPLALTEVSLVLKPRVASAALFGETDPAAGGEDAAARGDARDAEIGRLRAALRETEVGAQIAALKAAGRVVPATEGLVRALLSVPGEARVTLSAGTDPEPVAGVFLRFLQAMPPLVKFGEASAAGETPEGSALSAEEQAWLRERLGVDPATVAAALGA